MDTPFGDGHRAVIAHNFGKWPPFLRCDNRGDGHGREDRHNRPLRRGIWFIRRWTR